MLVGIINPAPGIPRGCLLEPVEEADGVSWPSQFHVNSHGLLLSNLSRHVCFDFVKSLVVFKEELIYGDFLAAELTFLSSSYSTPEREGGGGGHWLLVRMDWCPAGWSVYLPLLIFPCTIRSRSSLLALAHPGGPRKRAVKRLWCGGGYSTDGSFWMFVCQLFCCC